MMRSLFAGVSGLKTHQTRMDVIGNNIANVNTVAFKSSSMTFASLMSQTTQRASGANALTGTGGVNARQIGLGVKTSAINTDIEGQGASQSTGNPFDLMISGKNFFVVSDGTSNYFTRDGSFYVDGAGNLAMTSIGYNVMGWQAVTDPQTGELSIKKDTVSALRIMNSANMTYPPEATTDAYMSGIIDKHDTDVTGDGRIVNMKFFDSLGYSHTAKFTFKKVDEADGGDDYTYIMELMRIDDSENETLDLPNGVNDWKELFGEAITEINGTTIANPTQGMVIKFDQNTGNIIEPAAGTDGSIMISLDLTDLGTNYREIQIDMSQVTTCDNKGTSTIGATNGKDDAYGTGSGRRVGEMISLSIQQNGMIYAAYSNGMTKLLGQIATAQFANASGLEKLADNLYSATLNSGEFDGIGVDISEDGSYMTSGYLEMSNVDLSSEFTTMITTQRGFQANSRIITVSDTLLEELTNLKR